MNSELQSSIIKNYGKPYQVLTCQDCNSQMYPYEVIFLNQKVSGYVCAFCGRMVNKKEKIKSQKESPFNFLL